MYPPVFPICDAGNSSARHGEGGEYFTIFEAEFESLKNFLRSAFACIVLTCQTSGQVFHGSKLWPPRFLPNPARKSLLRSPRNISDNSHTSLGDPRNDPGESVLLFLSEVDVCGGSLSHLELGSNSCPFSRYRSFLKVFPFSGTAFQGKDGKF